MYQRIPLFALCLGILWLLLVSVQQCVVVKNVNTIPNYSAKYSRLLKPQLSLKYNRFPFQRMERPPISRVACLSETFNESLSHSGALLRSCRYEDICYSLKEQRLFLFPSRNHYKLVSMVHTSIFLSSMSKPVLASTVSSMISQDSFIRPHYQKHKQSNNYYHIHEKFQNTVWIPVLMSCTFQSVLWDIYLPIFSLLELFDLSSRDFGILLLNECNQAIPKIRQFAEMMQMQMPQIISLPVADQFLNHTYLCFHQAASGMGGLGFQQKRPPFNFSNEEFVPPRHTRRGKNIQNFRTYLVNQVWNSSSLINSMKQPKQLMLTYSRHISKSAISSISKDLIIKALRKSMTLREQAETVIMSRVLLLSSIEDKTVAIFLPKNSHLLLIGPPSDDWDFWTNHVSIHVHLLQAYVSGAIKYVVDEIMYFADISKEPDNLLLEENEAIPFVNNHSIIFRNTPPKSTKIHCVTEKLFPNNDGAQNFRSCHFENLCFDMKAKQFVIFPSPALSTLLTRLRRLVRHGNYFSTISQSMVLTPQPKSIMGLKYKKLQIYNETEAISSFYQLHANWISTHTFSVCNPGHILWDLWLPVFTILDMFGTSKYPLLVTHYPSKKKCILKIRKDMEVLLGISDGIVLNEIIEIPDPKSNYICADYSAGGFGWLSDHGFGSHGWVDAEMQYPVNYIRGPELRQSRLFFLKNIGISDIKEIEPPINILFSRNSSRDARRCVDFSAQIEVAKRLSSSSNRIKVQAVNFVNDTLKDQLKIVSKASIFITAAGGGSFPAFFLPFGATLIIYGDRNMHLDSDLYNNFGQFQVHWMSLSSMNEDLTLFLHLLMDEIAFLLSKSLHHNS